ncbi:DUF881 domain-containing protein [Sanguibacter antarcticus]|uniref:Uncharacterized protein YlxW (UPF0749 family) n=1 Tax=Sanguibacter antarcticus TaxID=372484 RepID=A0A2A9E2Q9_9MICO|nr:DUF881 domain-containing protein [Sanguibacter antarcticus]PFG33134.1 uncharacterized protein YlxW (UPF0749 family) [Sanguibacter antarcticus]
MTGRRLSDETLTGRPPVDASMTLLNEVMRQPLDPSYAAAARRRATDEPRTSRPLGVAALLVLAICLGLVTASAAVQLRAPQPAVLAARALLEEEIVSRRDQVEDKAAQNAALQTSIERLRDSALETTDPELLSVLRRDSVVSGTTAVRGPGLIITIEDGASAAEDQRALVQDTDLQVVVNALWEAGAEAIAINDQRLTATTAIRSAGSAILVDLVGVSGPYTVVAIGDRNGLETGFARSSAMRQLEGFASSYGIKTTLSGQDDVALRAGKLPVLYSASAIDDDNGSQ